MREAGISLYPDLADGEKVEKYILTAAESGCKRVFMSLILGDLNFAGAARPDSPVFADATAVCKRAGMDVWYDLNEDVIAYFGGLSASLDRVAEMGAHGVRIDSGLSPRELAKLTRHRSGLMLQLNCAGLRTDRSLAMREADAIMEAIAAEGDMGRVEACFNFYPRNGTGIAESSVKSACDYLRARGVRVSAFVASLTQPSLLHARSRGVPTAEKLRFASPYAAARVLGFLGVDDVLFGDGFASDAELTELCAAVSDEKTRLAVRYRDWVPDETKNRLADIVFANRYDEPAELIRGTASRGIKLAPRDTIERRFGDVTLDNDTSAQYAGELQIMLADLPAEAFADVVGRVADGYLPLLPYLRDGSREFVLCEDCEG